MTRQQVLNIIAAFENQKANAEVENRKEYATWCQDQINEANNYLIEVIGYSN